MRELPAQAAWRHVDTRDGFETARLHPLQDGLTITGATAATSEGETWAVTYRIELAPDWSTRRATVSSGDTRTEIVRADGRWTVDGVHVHQLDGVADLDLEASGLTNAFPIQRLAPAVGEAVDAPAAWVRAHELSVERLEQRYERLPDDGDVRRYAYAAPEHDFTSELRYDAAGLVLDYPGIATRVL